MAMAVRVWSHRGGGKWPAPVQALVASVRAGSGLELVLLVDAACSGAISVLHVICEVELVQTVE